MAFEVDLNDFERRIIRVANFPELARGPIRGELRDMSRTIATDIRTSIRPGGGRPSLPGAPPHSQSGNLEASISARMGRGRQRDERAYVLTRWPRGAHGHLLESGTDNRIVKKTSQNVGRVLPRPFAVPAATRRAGEFVARIQAAIDRTVAERNAG